MELLLKSQKKIRSSLYYNNSRETSSKKLEYHWNKITTQEKAISVFQWQ